jgi:hypothetical protein
MMLLAASAQQTVRRVPVIMVNSEADPIDRGPIECLFEKLGRRQWHNVQIDVRWADGSASGCAISWQNSWRSSQT